eukprot:TRINITY_DN9407_c0_g1_i4.p1 TRINITY_DN9407_c0_g1~~TRINITY_DN9407_c0_g1_i4.p1  ORF type:complete len:330 (+),score=16.35 TRINITY_DN9407_c0_g1_i4:35-1024(+)
MTSQDTESPDKDSQTEKLSCFGLDISIYPNWAQLTLCTIGVLLSSVSSAYETEKVYKLAEGFKIGWFVTLFELGVPAIISGFQHRGNVRVGSIKQHILLGLCFMLSRVLTNVGIDFLNYPIQVIFKSAKVILVMVTGTFVLRKIYSIWEYLSAFMLVVGVILFTLANVVISPSYTGIGIVLLLLALISDSVLGNLQEKMMKNENVSQNELLFYMNFASSLLCLAGMLMTGYFFVAINTLTTHQNNKEIWINLIICGILDYIVIHTIATLVKRFGAVTTTMVTSCRKVVTIVLSFYLFPKPFTMQHVFGAVLVFSAIMWNVMMKKNSHKK